MSPPVVYRTTAVPLVPQVRLLTDVSAFYGLLNVPIIAVGDDVRAGEILNLLTTLVGDEPFLPLFGCDLPKRVFEPITAALTQQLIMDAYLSVQTWLGPDVAVVPNQCSTIALSANRLAGIDVGYAYGGHLWNMPVVLPGVTA